MTILGINFNHDSAVAIIKENKIIAAIEEEKVSRTKQDFGWPKESIKRLFKEKNIKKKEVDIIALDKSFLEMMSTYDIKYNFTKRKFDKNQEYINRITSYLSLTQRTIKTQDNIKIFEKLIHDEGFINAKIVFYDHHLGHAASSYYTSPINIDLVITSDGMGGDSSFNFYLPSNQGLKLIKKNSYKVSVGAFYSMITKLLGFRPTRHEGKITGLAAYGKHTELIDKFRNLWKIDKDNNLSRYPFDKLNEEWNRLKISSKISYSEQINIKNASFGNLNDYAKRNLVLLGWLKENTKGFSKEDIAFACQKIAEEITLNEIKNVKNKLNKKRISVALSGGVFANVRINQFVYELDFVKNIFIHPAMGDSGLALGNAILADINFSSKKFIERNYPLKHTFLGPNYHNDLLEYIEEFDRDDIVCVEMKDSAKTIADLLYKNKIIGLWNGPLEWGPRALGNRSIILNTFDKTVNDTLNKRLNRTEFMPFAPVVLDKCAKKYFPKYEFKVPAADYMTITYDTDPKYHDLLQATVHIDGTARPQVVNKHISPLYYSILNEFHNISGCGAMVNTSFNAHEEQILSNPTTAINSLLTERVDYLVMENYLFYLKQKK